MYIRKSTRTYKDKTYTNHLLVESVHTAHGPRQRIICSLGSLEPAPAAAWRINSRPRCRGKGRCSRPRRRSRTSPSTPDGARGPRAAAARPIELAIDHVAMEDSREAGPVHVGHQVWQQLRIDPILRRAGLSARACVLTEAMTLNRLIAPLSEHAMPDWMRRTALSDILHTDFSTLDDDALYGNLDRLHPRRAQIERALAE